MKPAPAARIAGVLVGAVLASCAWAAGAPDAGLLDFDAREIAAIRLHGPWPPAPARDPSNRVSGNRHAAQFGARLFFDARLSTSGSISCANCHIAESGWSDARAVAVGLEETERNTRSVVNARFNRWFGWSGATDSLWAASIRPLLDPREMGGAERHVPALVRVQADLACDYRSAFGRAPPADDETLLVDIAKALAAFQETLVSGRTPFDEFRDALLRGDRRAAARYPLAAQRGLRLFVGAARCNVCHLGPHFTNGEFDKAGIAVRSASGRFDWGRYDGVKTLRAGRFNLLSRHNDDRSGANAVSTRHVALSVETYGAFKVPGLRNVALTAPYMHTGSLATLRDVVRHYSEIDEVKLQLAVAQSHAEPGDAVAPPAGASVLQPLNLSDAQIADMVAFLETLTEKNPLSRPPAPQTAVCK
jgi:cytochrome c peroxidase